MSDNQTIIHRHLRTISRINTGIALLGLLAVVGLYVWLRWFTPEASTPAAATASKVNSSTTTINQETITVADYQLQLNAVIRGYDWADAAVAQQKSSQVLELRVPAEMKQLHIQIVLALSDVQASNVDAGRQRMNNLKQQYGWLDYQP